MFSCNFPFPWWGVVAERAGNEAGLFQKGVGQVGGGERDSVSAGAGEMAD